jgi:hypothetical protein
VLHRVARKLRSAPVAWLVLILLLSATACSGLATSLLVTFAGTPAREVLVSAQGLQEPVTSAPPFWETWWFWGIVALVVPAVGVYLLWLRTVYARTRVLEDQVADRTKLSLAS